MVDKRTVVKKITKTLTANNYFTFTSTEVPVDLFSVIPYYDSSNSRPYMILTPSSGKVVYCYDMYDKAFLQAGDKITVIVTYNPDW